MPFIPHTPESLLPRSDSKNPATTCKGVIANGRPCRRSLAASPKASSRASPSYVANGVLALTSTGGAENVEAAAFFCWQHKDQAETLVGRGVAGRQTRVLKLQERTSTDTLVDRLGFLEVDNVEQKIGNAREGRRSSSSRPKTNIPLRAQIPAKRYNDGDPFVTTPGNTIPSRTKPAHCSQPKPRGESDLLLSLFCCVRASDEDQFGSLHRNGTHQEAGRTIVHDFGMEQLSSSPIRSLPYANRHPMRNERSVNDRSYAGYVSPAPMEMRPDTTFDTARNAQVSGQLPKASAHGRRFEDRESYQQRTSLTTKSTKSSDRPMLSHPPFSKTATLLSLIPQSLSPETTALLLTELAKPISPNDEEGFIYMFWLTPTTTTTTHQSSSDPPLSSIASSLLSPTLPTTPKNSRQRRTSDILQDLASTDSSRGTPTSKVKKTILLKIGRASNVQRRMNEWTRQCNYSLSLIRFYPYIPTTAITTDPSPSSPSRSPSHASPAPSPSLSSPQTPTIPRKVPHAHRIERLIHIELADKRRKTTCEVCAKEHREWFEIEGSREGVQGVDGVVRRWVEWGERGK
ncbi:MAG: hypothetical protein M1827_000478 [Pycnora praestabilis]|nr:MAG: hypothetical protein M1827_000478 [Pycnora praestabilis]